MNRKRSTLTVLSAFFLSVICFLIFLALYGVLGYGNRTILRGDLYAQYVDFIHLFLRVLKGKEDFWYTFSQYFGSPSILTYAYYAFSPFNLLYLPELISIPAMTIVIITIKIGLCGAAFSLFAKHVLKCSDLAAVFFALCYAMNCFNITLHFNIIWLESAYLFPVLILLVYRLVETGRWLAMVPVFILLFLSNFYMAFISGIFIAAAFIAFIVLRFKREDPTPAPILRLFVKFTASVVLAAGCCAAILLPCAKFLVSHMAADNIAFSELPTSFFDVINSTLLGVMPDIDNRIPFLYCGLPVVILVIHYFIRKDIPVKERITSGILLLFCALSIVFLPLFILTHAFDYPNFYFFRNSGIVCFLLCTLACRCFSVSKGCLKPRSLWVSIVSLICFYSFMMRFWPLYSNYSDVTNSSPEMALNILYLCIWGVLFMPHSKALTWGRKFEKLLIAICFILLMSELAVNGYLGQKHSDYEPFNESEYTKWYQAQKKVIDSIPTEDDQLYRVSMYGDNNYNSSALFGYNSFNTFSSSDLYELRMALYGMGISVSNRSITENGYTDLTYMLFDKGYTGNINRIEEKSDDRYSELDVFPWRLSIAYMVSDNIKNYKPGDDPFDNQEHFVECICGKHYHFFNRLELADLRLSSYNAKVFPIGDHTLFKRSTHHAPTAGVYFSVPKDPVHPFYACFRQTEPTSLMIAPYVLGSEDMYAENLTLSVGHIIKGGRVSDSFSQDTDNVAIYFTEDSLDSFACNDMYFARFDDSEMSALHNDLLPGILTLTSWSSSHLIGTVTASVDRPLLFTSIPWDEGWSAKVDGLSTVCESVLDGAFLSIPLSPGEHEVELKYIAPGAKEGLLFSIFSLLLYATFLIHTIITAKKSEYSLAAEPPVRCGESHVSGLTGATLL